MKKRRKITNPDALERIRAILKAKAEADQRKAEEESQRRRRGQRTLDQAVGDLNEFIYGVRHMQHTHRDGWIPADQRNYP